ncbi:uncharacterized protein LOC133178259 [Saccostrea echinata]|uniref:uncharacterized protein LOC133178259 n=1 Tax=Saccostrea echinata TaxID=191078 RepID=UPI002A82EF14|nr:uncharacterized protein LOC133178259 [Saccostrea echinata]
MDPRTSAQDVKRCDLCETAVLQMHCDTCLVNLCKACVGEHFSADLSKPHKIVDFKDRKSTLIHPRCASHGEETCEMYCTHCDVPVCSICLASDQHLGHKLVRIQQIRDEKRDKLIKKQTELKESIYPIYQDIASDVQNRMSQLEKEYGDLSTAITKYGEDLHREIDKLVKKLKAEIDEMKNTQLKALRKHLVEIKKTISDIKDEIKSIDSVLDSTHISSLFNVPSTLDEYKKLPRKITVSLPKFSLKKLLTDQLFSLKIIPLKSDEYGYSMKTTQKSPEAGSSPLVKQLLDQPETVTIIDTGYDRCLKSVACLSDEGIWTGGDGNNMKLYSINQGSLLKSIATKSGNTPWDIAVTKSGDLVYTDINDGTVNIVKNEKIEEVIRLQNWKPYNVCSTSSGDLLVIMDSDENKPTKVVRYCGSTEKQTIQFDDKGKPIYSSGLYIRYITENRSLDICVSDSEAEAIVVVNQAGKLRFRYTGHTLAPENKSFYPRGITTDSQSHILTADYNKNCVHIIDQDGQFLRYIDCGLNEPQGLCTDTNDNLFVAQFGNRQVRKIIYCHDGDRHLIRDSSACNHDDLCSFMNPRTSAQDVMRCDLCETAVVQMHCDTCLVNLCKACLGEHFSADLSKPHKIVDFKDRKSTLIHPRCTSHGEETCEMYCTHCDVPVCCICLASDQHLGHKLVRMQEIRDEKRDKLIKKQTELKEKIYPTYQDIASDVQSRMSQLEKEYGDLSTAITKHGEDWHREIDKLVKKLKAEIDEMKNTQLQTLQKQLGEISKKISEIKDEIESIDSVLESTHISSLFSVPSTLDEYRKLPRKITVSLPKFSPKKIQADKLFSLKTIPLKSDEHGYNIKTSQKSPEAGSFPAVKQLLKEPETVTTIDTGPYNDLLNVACLSDEEIWTSRDDSTMKLYRINQGSLLKSITTKSGYKPYDIAVTKSGDLVYTDYNDKTVNIVKNEKIDEIIRLQNWKPRGVCSTSSGDFLVIMHSNDYTQTKVVRYFGSTEKQTIQFDDERNPIYSSGGHYRYITENRNLDICVAECGPKAVVVVNQAGKLRFRYTGHTPAPKNIPFNPRGITTDSQGHILTADDNNDCVHIINQDGHFLCYIDCGLSGPWGLCTDTNDNLFVAQCLNKQVKKIKYMYC